MKFNNYLLRMLGLSVLNSAFWRKIDISLLEMLGLMVLDDALWVELPPTPEGEQPIGIEFWMAPFDRKATGDEDPGE